jgi:ketosteroid isomerase-like protein
VLTVGQAVEAFWNAYNAHDLDALLSLADDDLVVRFPLSPEPISGKSEISAIWSLIFYQLVPDIRQEVVTILVNERSAACELIERGTVRVPGACDAAALDPPRKYEQRIAAFLALNDQGRIDRLDFYWDTAAFARQLELNVDALGDFHAQAISLGQWVDRATTPVTVTSRTPDLQSVV